MFEIFFTIMLRKQVVVFFLACFIGLNAELAPFITKCKRSDINFNSCLKEQANNVWKHLLKGNIKYDGPHLVPFAYPRIFAKPYDVDFGLEIENSKIYILDKIKIEDINIDFKNQTMQLILSASIGKWQGDYSASGKLNNSSYDHTGEWDTTFDTNIGDFNAQYELKNIDGLIYMQLKNEVFSFQSNKIIYKLSSREGRKIDEARDLTNKFNEEYQDLHKEVIPTIKVLTANVLSSIINSVLRTETYCKLFDD